MTIDEKNPRHIGFTIVNWRVIDIIFARLSAKRQYKATNPKNPLSN